jgi:hypothetical protein
MGDTHSDHIFRRGLVLTFSLKSRRPEEEIRAESELLPVPAYLRANGADGRRICLNSPLKQIAGFDVPACCAKMRCSSLERSPQTIHKILNDRNFPPENELPQTDDELPGCPARL